MSPTLTRSRGRSRTQRGGWQNEQDYGRSREAGRFDEGRSRGYGGEDYRSAGSDYDFGWEGSQQRSGQRGSGDADQRQGYNDPTSSQHGGQGQYGSQQGYGSQRQRSGSQQTFGSQGQQHGGLQGYGDPSGGQSQGWGQYKGMGPKNYSRSDDRIHEDVCDRLSDDGKVNASEIDVQVSSGEVTLAGTVKDREQRRLAEDCVEAVSGVKHVQNNLRVQSEGSSTQSKSSTSTFGSGTSTNTSLSPTNTQRQQKM